MAQIHERYRSRGFDIFAFPCNQFKEQEPGSNAEIKAYAQKTYGAQWTMFAKTEVNGPNTCAPYAFLRRHSELYDPAK